MSRQSLCGCALLCAVWLLFSSVGLSADHPTDGAAASESPREWPERIRRSLLRPVQPKLVDTPLEDALRFLSEVVGEPIRMDVRALEEVGIAPDEPVTFQAGALSSEAALNLMLRKLDLTWILRDEVILITTLDEAANDLETKVYDVVDILRPELHARGAGGRSTASKPLVSHDFDSLIDVITACVDPDSWSDVGGTGDLQPYGNGPVGALTVSHTDKIHEELARLFAAIREVNTSKTPERIVPATSDRHQASVRKAKDAMRKLVSLDCSKARLRDVVEYVAEHLDIPLLLDQQALEEVGVMLDEPITFCCDEITAKAALELMLHSLELTWIVHNDVVLITTVGEAESMPEIHVYDVTDLVVTADASPRNWTRRPAGATYYDFDSLIDIVHATVEPDSWDDVGGTGNIQPLHSPVGMLVCSQTVENHDKLARLFAALRTAREGRKGVEKDATVGSSLRPPAFHETTTPTAAKVEAIEALSRKVKVEFDDTSLGEAVAVLAKQTGVSVFLDRHALEQVRILSDEPVTFQIEDVTLRSGLDLMLKTLDMAWVPTDAGLLITTPDEAAHHLFIRVYDVSDLPSYRTPSGEPVTDMPVTDMEELIQLIVPCIEPDSWDEVGGIGSINAFAPPGLQVLIVSQTYDVHEEIAKLLDDLRRLRGGPLTAEMVKALPTAAERLAALPLAPRPIPENLKPNFPYFEQMARRRKNARRLSPPLSEDIPELPQLVADNNRFAVDLYGKLRSGDRGNLLVSPYGISAAMAMTYAGARGETAKEMAKALYFALPNERLHSAFGGLSNYFNNELGSDCDLRVANRMWGQIGSEFLDPFLKTTREHYGAELGRLDFAHSEHARQIANAWIERRTAGQIRELLGPGDLDEATRLVLTNTVYFNGRWASPFSADRTQKAPFSMRGGFVGMVPMMSQSIYCPYTEDEQVQVLAKPYADHRLSMVVVLPKKGACTLATIDEELSAEKLSGWISQLGSAKVWITLPKFTFRSKFELSKSLKRMGIKRLFEVTPPGNADLSGMRTERDLFLSKILHEAWIKVDEAGTEATAATVGGMVGGMGMGGGLSYTFRADHPFLFLIRDNASGTILFIGRVVSPNQAR